MDSNQLPQMLQQYMQEGKDIQTLFNDYQTLAASGKTPLGLNRWQKSDKPRMEDFNEDNRIIDEKLRGLAEEKANKGPISNVKLLWIGTWDGSAPLTVEGMSKYSVFHIVTSSGQGTTSKRAGRSIELTTTLVADSYILLACLRCIITGDTLTRVAGGSLRLNASGQNGVMQPINVVEIYGVEV